MLILSRKKDERIVINDDITIRIVDVKADTVKIGIEAPDHIKIYREEVWDSIHEENKEAASADVDKVSQSILSVNKELSARVKQSDRSSKK